MLASRCFTLVVITLFTLSQTFSVFYLLQHTNNIQEWNLVSHRNWNIYFQRGRGTLLMQRKSIRQFWKLCTITLQVIFSAYQYHNVSYIERKCSRKVQLTAMSGLKAWEKETMPDHKLTGKSGNLWMRNWGQPYHWFLFFHKVNKILQIFLELSYRLCDSVWILEWLRTMQTPVHDVCLLGVNYMTFITFWRVINNYVAV